MINRAFAYSFSLLNMDYVRLDRRWNYRNIVSPYYRLYYIDGGEGTISNETDHIRLESGFLYLVPSFTPCNLACPEFLSQYFLQFFEESAFGISLFANNRKLMGIPATRQDILAFKRLLEINPGRGLNRSDDPRVYEKNVYYQEYQDLNHHQPRSTFFETQGIIIQLLSRFLGEALFEEDPGRIPQKVTESLAYIQQNLGTALTVKDLAGRANLHPEYFSRLFLKYTGERPINYIHAKRIERAQHLIAVSNQPYEQIAFQAGFESQHYFSRVFKKVTGLTPGQYKLQNHSLALHPNPQADGPATRP